jgi:hypothetical protein
MKIYFKEGVFYREDEYGARTKLIEDPDQVWPTKWVPDPDWTPPNVPYVVGEPIPEAPLIEVNDYSGGALMVEAENPDCTVPEDAVEIPYERYIECLDGLLLKGAIVADVDGLPLIVPAPPVDPAVELTKTRVRHALYFLASTEWLVTLDETEVYTIPAAIVQARARAAAFIAAHPLP